MKCLKVSIEAADFEHMLLTQSIATPYVAKEIIV